MINSILEALFNLNDLGYKEVVRRYGWKLEMATNERLIFTDGLGNAVLVWVWHDRTGGRGKRANHVVTKATWTINSPNYPDGAIGIMRGDSPEELNAAMREFENNKEHIMQQLKNR